MMRVAQMNNCTHVRRTLLGDIVRHSETTKDKDEDAKQLNSMVNAAVITLPSSTNARPIGSPSLFCGNKEGLIIDIINATADLLDPHYDGGQEGLAVEPIPIGPSQTLRLVDAVPLSDCNSLLFDSSSAAEQEALFNVLQPLLHVQVEGPPPIEKGAGAVTNNGHGVSANPDMVLSSSARTKCTFPKTMKALSTRSAMKAVSPSSRSKRRRSSFATSKDGLGIGVSLPTKQMAGASSAISLEDVQQRHCLEEHGETFNEQGLLVATTSGGGEGDHQLPAFKNKEAERFRPYQSDQWNDRFQDLIDFRNKHGHCLVPHNFPENPQLAQWTKRQRYQYKQKQLKLQSTLTTERQAALERMGFVWHSHKAGWMEKFRALKQFKSMYGHCNVPSNYIDHPLAVWVKCQRRQYKLYLRGVRSTMTSERHDLLELLGFAWNPRNLK